VHREAIDAQLRLNAHQRSARPGAAGLMETARPRDSWELQPEPQAEAARGQNQQPRACQSAGQALPRGRRAGFCQHPEAVRRSIAGSRSSLERD